MDINGKLTIIKLNKNISIFFHCCLPQLNERFYFLIPFFLTGFNDSASFLLYNIWIKVRYLVILLPMSFSYVQLKYFKERFAKSQTEAFLKITVGDGIIIAIKRIFCL